MSYNSNQSKIREIVRTLYKNDMGEPMYLSPTQCDIFSCIYKLTSPDGKRNIHVTTFTQYGKSETVAMAILTRISTFSGRVALVAPSDKKAKVIMGYIIKHIFDNPYTKSRFVIAPGESEDRIRRERSKNRLTFKTVGGEFGEVFIVSAQSHRNKNPLDALMGFGAPTVIIDESSLIEDVKYAGILRMLGAVCGSKHLPFLLEIGNPFRRNHFFNSSIDKKYYHIVVDYKKGLAEGRITEEQVERMRVQAFFDIMYECKFPEPGEIDERGWIPLLTEDNLKEAMNRKVQQRGIFRGGQDVGDGRAFNAYVYRCENYAYIKHGDKQPDPMVSAGYAKIFMDEDAVDPANWFVDSTGGDGKAIVNRLRELKKIVNSVNFATTENVDTAAYLNNRAEMYMKARKWILQGGALENNHSFKQLLNMKYRVMSSNGKTQMIPKILLLQTYGVIDLDFADAFITTFYKDYQHDLSKQVSGAYHHEYENPADFDPITGDPL